MVDVDIEAEDAFEGGDPAVSLVGVPSGVLEVGEFLEEEFEFLIPFLGVLCFIHFVSFFFLLIFSFYYRVFGGICEMFEGGDWYNVGYE